MTNETALREAAIKVAAQIEMDREGYPLSRTQQEIYDDAAEIVDAVFALQSPSQPVVAEAVDFNTPPHMDPEFVTAWCKMEDDGYIYSESNVAKVHLGWCMAKKFAHPQASPPPVQSERPS